MSVRSKIMKINIVKKQFRYDIQIKISINLLITSEGKTYKVLFYENKYL